MILRDFHIHTTYGDGENSPEEMVLAAIAMGVEELGFSEHSYTAFDVSYCMKYEDIPKYNAEIRSLKEKYKGKIKIHLGIEQDYYSETPTDGYEYVVGSVHYVKFGDEYVPVDDDAQTFRRAVEKYCGGDVYKFCEEYYATVANLAKKVRPNIVAHIDLVTKFNEQDPMIDESNPRYVAAWKRAVDELMKNCTVFEINPGAITRGYRTAPYPSGTILNYLKSKGANIIVSSDSHSKEGICYNYAEYCKISDGNKGAEVLLTQLKK